MLRTMTGQALPALFAAPSLLNANIRFAALLWGSVGVGYWIYGKRQSSLAAMFGGVAMVAVSYWVTSAWLMSAICVALGFMVYAWMKREG